MEQGKYKFYSGTLLLDVCIEVVGIFIGFIVGEFDLEDK